MLKYTYKWLLLINQDLFLGDTCLVTTYIMKKNQRQLRIWLCHGRVNILSGGHSCKMPEGPWLTGWSHHRRMVVCSLVCRFLFSCILTLCFATTISPLSSFSIPLANFICHYPILWETSSLKSWPIITSPFLCLLSDMWNAYYQFTLIHFCSFPFCALAAHFLCHLLFLYFYGISRLLSQNFAFIYLSDLRKPWILTVVWLWAVYVFII